MRKYMAVLVALTFVLFALGAMAQSQSSSSGSSQYPSASTSSSQSQSNPSTSTTTSTTSQTTTTTSAAGQERSVEGCVAKEQFDFFLIPRTGNPIKLQASMGEDLSAHVGHQVKLRGNESSLSASAATAGGMTGTAAGTSGTSTQGQTGTSGSVAAPSAGTSAGATGAATGTGNDLHSLADKQLSVDKITMVSETCPVNWNPKFPGQSGASGTSNYPR